jgi:hypothetical protein
MVLRNVAKTFSLEEQRQEINEIAVDLDAVNTTLANWNAGDWDTAYSWGDHAQAGYWVDNATSRSNWDTAYGWGDHGTVGYWVEDSVKITNWDTAYGWGDHGAAGYLVATAVSYNNTNWDTSYSWGDHALAGYLTSYTETDPVFGASAASGIAAGDITNWDTAYGWGDHGTAGYAASGDIPTPGGTYSGAGTPEDPIIESIQLNAGSGNFGGDSLLVWNTTDNRLGIGVADPKNEVHILKGSGGGDVSLRVTNQSSVDAGTTASIYLGTSPTDTFNTFYIRAFRDSGATHLGYSDPDAVDHDPNIILPSAGGLEFGTQTDTAATGSTKSSATLDHYEEGTWTPVYEGGGTFSCTYAQQTGHFTRIGRVVYVHGVISTATVSGVGSGPLKVAGLPFTVNNGRQPLSIRAIAWSGGTFDQTPQFATFEDGDDHFEILRGTSNGSTDYVADNMLTANNQNILYFSGFYTV